MARRVYSPASGPDDLLVRDADRDDVPAMLAIYNHAVEHTTATYDLAPVSLAERLDWYDHKIADGCPVLVAERGGAVVGWSTFGPFRPKAGYDHTVEHSVYVAADAQGGGIGSALLRPLVTLAREAGKHVMIGGVDAENEGSIAFHRRHGFVETGRIRQVGRKFDRWLDVAFLQLTLDDSPAP